MDWKDLFLVYANNVNSLGKNINTVRKNRSFIFAQKSRENEKLVYFLSPEGMSESNIKIANKPFKNMAKSKYLGMPQKYKNYMH
jgi:hypothetical protein